MSDEKSPEPKGFVRRHAAKLVASAVITAGIVFTLQKGGLTLVPEGGDFAARPLVDAPALRR